MRVCSCHRRIWCSKKHPHQLEFQMQDGQPSARDIIGNAAEAFDQHAGRKSHGHVLLRCLLAMRRSTKIMARATNIPSIRNDLKPFAYPTKIIPIKKRTPKSLMNHKGMVVIPFAARCCRTNRQVIKAEATPISPTIPTAIQSGLASCSIDCCRTSSIDKRSESNRLRIEAKPQPRIQAMRHPLPTG